MTIRRLIHDAVYLPLRNIHLPVVKGILKGKKWTLGCGRAFRFLTTTYEESLTKALERTIKEGNVFYDIGAHVGYYSLIASVLAGDKGRVFAFEPCPENLSMLKKHVAINSCNNITVFDLAVSDRKGECCFDAGVSSWEGRLSVDGSIKVNTISIDELINENKIPVANCVKIDVEGAEVKVLEGGRNFFATHSPVIFLSCHGEEEYATCKEMLVSWGYRTDTIDRNRDPIYAYKV